MSVCLTNRTTYNSYFVKNPTVGQFKSNSQEHSTSFTLTSMQMISTPSMKNQRKDKIFELDDDYEHVDDSLEYIIENVLMEKASSATTKSFENLSNLYNSFYDSYCNCSEPTSNCSSDYQTCIHGGSYSTFGSDANEKELVLNKDRGVQDLLYECNSQCSCSPKLCTNRLVQFGPRKHLKMVTAANLTNQLALSTDEHIPEGGFICEYAGEVLTEQEALKRNIRNRDQQLKNYLICLNEYSTNTPEDVGIDGTLSQCIQTFIDAGIKSNIGRYLNHSCDPNCEILSVRIDCPIPKLGEWKKFDIFFVF